MAQHQVQLQTLEKHRVVEQNRTDSSVIVPVLLMWENNFQCWNNFE